MESGNTRLPLIVVLLVQMLLLSACSADDDAAQAGESSSRPATATLTLGVVVDPAWGQVPVAQTYDLFEQAEVDVEVVSFSSGADAMEALAGGAVEVATAADVPTSAAIINNEDIRVLAQGAYHDNMRFVTDARNGIVDLQDLQGRRIGTAFGTSAHFMATTFLEQAGVEAELVQVAPPEMEIAMERGDIEVAAIFEPYATQIAEKLGDDAVAIVGDPPYVSSVYYNTRVDVLDADSDGVARLLGALRCGSELLSQGDTRAVEAVGAATGLEGEVLTSVLKAYTYRLSLNDSVGQELSLLARWAGEEGNIDADVQIHNYLDYFDNGPLSRAEDIQLPRCS